MRPVQQTSFIQHLFRIILGVFMVMVGIGHLSFMRQAFQAQVPDWLPLNKDLTVVLSGIVELFLGLSLLFWKTRRIEMGIFLAVFFVLIFPGNLAQYLGHRDAFGLDTDAKRLIRLFFQPVLILWVLWSTGALKKLFRSRQ